MGSDKSGEYESPSGDFYVQHGVIHEVIASKLPKRNWMYNTFYKVYYKQLWES